MLLLFLLWLWLCPKHVQRLVSDILLLPDSPFPDPEEELVLLLLFVFPSPSPSPSL